MKKITQNGCRCLPFGTIALAFVLFIQTSFPASSQNGSGLDQGLILWYPFCGNAKDESGNDRHGEVNGATLTEDRFGKADRAYKMVRGSATITSPFTFDKAEVHRTASIWFKPEKWGPGSPGYFSRYAGTGNVDLLYGVNPALKIWDNGTAGLDGPFQNAVFTGDALELNEWYHLVLTYSGKMSTIKIWINGKLMKHETSGFGNYGGDKPFKVHSSKILIPGTACSVDELRIYDRALSEAEVLQLYNKEKASTSSNCSNEGNTESPRGRLNTIIIPRGLIPARIRWEGPPPSLWRTNLAPRLLTNIILPFSPRGQRIAVRIKGGKATPTESSPLNATPSFTAIKTSEGEFTLPEGKPTD